MNSGDVGLEFAQKPAQTDVSAERLVRLTGGVSISVTCTSLVTAACDHYSAEMSHCSWKWQSPSLIHSHTEKKPTNFIKHSTQTQ